MQHVNIFSLEKKVVRISFSFFFYSYVTYLEIECFFIIVKTYKLLSVSVLVMFVIVVCLLLPVKLFSNLCYFSEN